MHRPPDPDSLALHALGEPALTTVDLDHIEVCEACARSLAELRETVDVVRGGPQPAVEAVPVPDRVWDGIARELDLGTEVRPRPLTEPVRAREPVEQPSANDSVVPLVRGGSGRRHAGRRTAVLAVAASAALVAALGTAVVRGTGADEQVLARSQLDEFGVGEGTGAGGSARLVSTDGTSRGLELELTGLPSTEDGYLEAWLIDPDTGGIVSLGTIDPSVDLVQLAVPEELDATTYSLVDVSVEPYDGDPTHSGASLLRGTLGT